MEAMALHPPLSPGTYWAWVAADYDGLFERDAQARVLMLRVQGDRISTVSSGDHRKSYDETSDTLVDNAATNDPGAIQRDRLDVDGHKWYLSKCLPEQWGEKLAAMQNTITDSLPMTEEDIDLAQEAALAKHILARDSKAKPKP
jgi:hypothetical protein